MRITDESLTAHHEQHVQEWAEGVYELFKAHHVELISFVPDSGHKHLIAYCQSDPALRAVALTTEEEGIALAAGAFLGGKRSAILMQSSGVGNCINMLSLPRVCNMPLLALVTMRGEWGEFNPWQVPMGQGTPMVLEASGVIVYRVDSAEELPRVLPPRDGTYLTHRLRAALLGTERALEA
jgi:sulfopyruvate decarboxylase alpha subunit